MAAHRSTQAWALALTGVALFMVLLDGLVVITALPAIERDLAGGLATLEWTVNAYNLALAGGVITAAALGDRFGRRRIFVAGLALFTAASAACALAPTAELLIAARAIQGLGAAAVLPLSLTILTSSFPPERRGTVVGLWGGIAGLAVAAGPVVGGAVTQGLNWHWIFWVNVPIGLVVTTLCGLRLAESRGPATRVDLPAVGLGAGGAAAFIWGLVRAGDTGWASPEAVAGMGLGILLLAGFVAWESRAQAPMLPLRLFRSGAFSAAVGTSFLQSAAMFGGMLLISHYLQLVLGDSPLVAGLHFLPLTAMAVVAGPAAGVLSDRIGLRPVMAGGMLLIAAGLGWFALAATAGAGYGNVVAAMVLFGIGASMVFSTAPTAALMAVEPVDMGKASGVNGTLQRFGSVFGVAVTTSAFAANGHVGTAASFDSGLHPALAVGAGLAVAGALTALAVAARRRPKAGTVPAAEDAPPPVATYAGPSR